MLDIFLNELMLHFTNYMGLKKWLFFTNYILNLSALSLIFGHQNHSWWKNDFKNFRYMKYFSRFSTWKSIFVKAVWKNYFSLRNRLWYILVIRPISLPVVFFLLIGFWSQFLFFQCILVFWLTKHLKRSQVRNLNFLTKKCQEPRLFIFIFQTYLPSRQHCLNGTTL